MKKNHLLSLTLWTLVQWREKSVYGSFEREHASRPAKKFLSNFFDVQSSDLWPPTALKYDRRKTRALCKLITRLEIIQRFQKFQFQKYPFQTRVYLVQRIFNIRIFRIEIIKKNLPAKCQYPTSKLESQKSDRYPLSKMPSFERNARVSRNRGSKKRSRGTKGTYEKEEEGSPFSARHLLKEARLMARDVCSDILWQPCSKPVNESKLISSSAWPTSKGRRATSTPIERDRQRQGKRGGAKDRDYNLSLFTSGFHFCDHVHAVFAVVPPFLRFSSPSPVKLPSPISYLFAAFAPVLFRRFPKCWIFGRICGWIWLHSHSGYRRGCFFVFAV